MSFVNRIPVMPMAKHGPVRSYRSRNKEGLTFLEKQVLITFVHSLKMKKPRGQHDPIAHAILSHYPSGGLHSYRSYHSQLAIFRRS
jgi:hypothetical protein